MIINANTKISALLKEHPEALDTIISISSAFEKLRNPILRKLMAGRTSISMASKIGGVTVHDFFEKLRLLGFDIDGDTEADVEEKKQLPEFLINVKKDQIVELDVRPTLAAGGDPLSAIMAKVKELSKGQVLKIINTFEPIPLIQVLEKKNFTSYSDVLESNWVETYFYKNDEEEISDDLTKVDASHGWEEVLERFKDNMVTIDVRHLEMPQPMMTILANLETLPENKALFVHHKRIPVFLLPELADRNFDYRAQEISDSEVKLLIFKA